MGCGRSVPVADEETAKNSANSAKNGSFLSRRRVNVSPQLDERMQSALKIIIADKEKKMGTGDFYSTSFNRIILKFPAIRRAFISIRSVFREFDIDNSGTIDCSELHQCMQSLGAEIDEAGVEEMFRYAVMTHNNKKKEALSFKEFLLCLAIGSVLQLFPLFRAYSGVDLSSVKNVAENPDAGVAAADTTHPVSDENNPLALGRTSSRLFDNPNSQSLIMQGRHLVSALKLILEAYILFDQDGSGTIDHDEVLNIIEEENKKAKEARKKKDGKGDMQSSVLLSRERWEELDWDSDGQISFKEFLFALMNWVGMDDEEDDPIEDEIVPVTVKSEVAPPIVVTAVAPSSPIMAPGSAGGLHPIIKSSLRSIPADQLPPLHPPTPPADEVVLSPDEALEAALVIPPPMVALSSSKRIADNFTRTMSHSRMNPKLISHGLVHGTVIDTGVTRERTSSESAISSARTGSSPPVVAAPVMATPILEDITESTTTSDKKPTEDLEEAPIHEENEIADNIEIEEAVVVEEDIVSSEVPPSSNDPSKQLDTAIAETSSATVEPSEGSHEVEPTTTIVA